jgi:type II secretory pathway component PulJ
MISIGKRTTRRHRGCAGFTLIELIGTIAVTSAMMTLLTVWIHQSIKQSRHFQTVQRDQQALDRLSADVRRSVWLAQSVKLTNPKVLDLTMASGNEVRYRLKGGTLRRMERDSTQRSISTEQFKLPRESRVAWQHDQEAKTLSLVIRRAPASISTASATEQDAQTKKDLSFDGRLALTLTARIGRWAATSRETPQ